jgi:uncharacterized membrane protein YoaT (DUF817 family)
MKYFHEFIIFGIKQAWACLFGGIMVALILASFYFYPKGAWLARYDFLFIAACLVQVILLLTKLETWEEAKVIALFHIAGTLMEVYKTAHGSWIYPEANLIRIGGVPLFSGFMYACVGSYIARSWKVFDYKFTNHPQVWQFYLFGAAVYVNFFTHHYLYDFRYILFAVNFWLFFKCTIYFKNTDEYRYMPMFLSQILCAVFVWIAENVATFSKIWLYPNQVSVWKPVGIDKFGSWLLLLAVSYALVLIVNKPEEVKAKA